MIKPMLYDVVEILLPIDESNLPAGSRGTLVHRHSEDVFEVEFVNEQGETIALHTLDRNHFVVVWQVETGEDVSLVEQVAQVVALLPPQARTQVLDFARFLSLRQTQQAASTSVAA